MKKLRAPFWAKLRAASHSKQTTQSRTAALRKRRKEGREERKPLGGPAEPAANLKRKLETAFRSVTVVLCRSVQQPARKTERELTYLDPTFLSFLVACDFCCSRCYLLDLERPCQLISLKPSPIHFNSYRTCPPPKQDQRKVRLRLASFRSTLWRPQTRL